MDGSEQDEVTLVDSMVDNGRCRARPPNWLAAGGAVGLMLLCVDQALKLLPLNSNPPNLSLFGNTDLRLHRHALSSPPRSYLVAV